MFGTQTIRDFLSLRLVILHFHSISQQVPQNGKVAMTVVKVCIYKTTFVNFLHSITIAVSYCTTVFQARFIF